MKFEWEQIYESGCDSNTWRARALDGWLVRHQSWSGTGDDGATPVATSLIFLPDPNWDWVID